MNIDALAQVILAKLNHNNKQAAKYREAGKRELDYFFTGKADGLEEVIAAMGLTIELNDGVYCIAR